MDLKEYQFLLEENRKSLYSIEGKFSGSNAHISEMRKVHQDSFKFCGDIPNPDFSIHSINWPLVIILDTVNVATHLNIKENKPSQSSQMTYFFCYELIAFYCPK